MRSAALAAIPLILFVVAAVPRVWVPDLVPFGEPQAAYVSEAIRRAPVSLQAWYSDPTVPSLALLDPLLRGLPSPIVAWVVLRGLLDALGVGLLYLAVRPLVGVWPAALAALLYALNPVAWTATRDPAGPLGAVVTAAVLLAAVRLVQQRTILRGAVLAVVLLAIEVPAALRTGLNVRAGWPGALWLAAPAVLTVAFALIPFLLVLPLASRSLYVRLGGVAIAILLGLAAASLGVTLNSREQRSTQFTTLRDWSALANAVHETAARVAAREVVLPAHQGAISSSRPLQALLRDDALVREVEAAVVLPLERETVFVLESATWQPVELGRPSSLTMVATPDGVDTGARIVTLRPRAATDWLARVQVVQDGRFADGSQLVGLSVESARSGQVDVSLYWQVPAASDGRSIAMAGRARDRSQLAVPNQSTGDFSLPDVAVRRTGELVVTRVMLPDVRQGTGERTLAVSLQRADGGPIRTIGGADALDVPLGSAPR